MTKKQTTVDIVIPQNGYYFGAMLSVTTKTIFGYFVVQGGKDSDQQLYSKEGKIPNNARYICVPIEFDQYKNIRRTGLQKYCTKHFEDDLQQKLYKVIDSVVPGEPRLVREL